ncbi:MAG TPA: putative transporter [Bacteroidales bacterium]|nr:putative transporter [Bacteroidales bacterium]
MNFIQSLFSGTGTATTILFISFAAFVGILIGKLEFKKVKLGIAGVLFSGLIFAHFGAQADPHVLHFVREFGLILFVYAIGIDVGPRFFSTFRNDGLKLNLFAAGIVVTGFSIAYFIHAVLGVSPAVITGIMSGAVTNTPGLGAAQQALNEVGQADAAAVTGMGYAVAYPFGVLGIIITMILVRFIFSIKVNKEVEDYNGQYSNSQKKLESVEIYISNPNMFGKEIKYIKKIVDKELVISRIERDGKFLVAKENEKIQQGDVIYGVSAINLIENLRMKMGEVKIGSKREISGDLAMFHVLVTNRKLTGKTIEQIGIYRRYEANITRIFRAGMEILPTHDTTVELGDTVRVVGKRDLLPEIREELGNSVKELAHPNTIPIFLGIFLGIILGSVPLFIPGLPAPAKLGMAGGPLLIAIILGYKGRIKNLDFYMTPGANMMLRELGIILFLACVGLSSGSEFVKTLVNGGYIWLLYGAAITFIPIFLASVIARLMKMNYLKICGIVSGAMTDPPALEFANSLAPVHAQSTAYATVYPLTMFLRILLAQTLILITL